jgi:hypothetical protein
MADDWSQGTARQIVVTIGSEAIGFQRDGDQWVRGTIVDLGGVVSTEGGKRYQPADLIDALRGPLGALPS